MGKRSVPTIFDRRWWHGVRLRLSPPYEAVYISSFGQFTIQGMPNLSTHMPKPLEKKVLPNGIRTVPPSASALKRRSASAGSSTCSETAKPCGWMVIAGRGVGGHQHLAVDRDARVHELVLPVRRDRHVGRSAFIAKHRPDLGAEHLLDSTSALPRNCRCRTDRD